MVSARGISNTTRKHHRNINVPKSLQLLFAPKHSIHSTVKPLRTDIPQDGHLYKTETLRCPGRTQVNFLQKYLYKTNQNFLDKTDKSKTNSFIRQTLSFVPISKCHCKSSHKPDTSDFEDYLHCWTKFLFVIVCISCCVIGNYFLPICR